MQLIMDTISKAKVGEAKTFKNLTVFPILGAAGGGADYIEFLPVEDETNYWVKIDGRPHVYKVFESAFKVFQRDPQTVRATGPAGS